MLRVSAKVHLVVARAMRRPIVSECLIILLGSEIWPDRGARA